MIENKKYTHWKIDGNVSWVAGVPDFTEADFREGWEETFEQQEWRLHPGLWQLSGSRPPCVTPEDGVMKSCRRCEADYRGSSGAFVSGAFCAWWAACGSKVPA